MTRNRSSQRNSNVSSPSRSQRKIPIPSIHRHRSYLPCILSPPTIPVSVNALSQCASPPCKLNQTLNTQIVKSQQSHLQPREHIYKYLVRISTHSFELLRVPSGSRKLSSAERSRSGRICHMSSP